MGLNFVFSKAGNNYAYVMHVDVDDFFFFLTPNSIRNCALLSKLRKTQIFSLTDPVCTGFYMRLRLHLNTVLLICRSLF